MSRFGGKNQAPGLSTGSTVADELKKLSVLEAKTGNAGAVSETPKMQLLNSSDVAQKHPDKRVRWASLANKDKMEVRKANGYEVIPVSEGGRQVGNMVLIAIPRQEYERRLAEVAKRNKEWLEAHNREMEEMAHNVAKILRDQYGFNVDEKNILIQG